MNNYFGVSVTNLHERWIAEHRVEQNPMRSTWRDSANKVINRVFADYPDATEQEMRKHLRDAYPFGERAMHPYKIWCDAVKKAMRMKYRIQPGEQLEITEGLFKP